MTTYRIESVTGIDFGTYEAASASDALRAMAIDAGHPVDEIDPSKWIVTNEDSYEPVED